MWAPVRHGRGQRRGLRMNVSLRLVAGDIDDPTAINVVLNPTG
ncbi:hypothetical protein GFS60_06982 (plasmid) [Rhodococcus sp. WAY2]|nr:hypothetical protein GFS60_06982 [Rhodococcus sp. WAY2]